MKLHFDLLAGETVVEHSDTPGCFVFVVFSAVAPRFWLLWPTCTQTHQPRKRPSKLAISPLCWPHAAFVRAAFTCQRGSRCLSEERIAEETQGGFKEERQKQHLS